MQTITGLFHKYGLAQKTIDAFQKEIYEYYSLHRRAFPWRGTTNPYHILVSEIMLQQTQTSRVVQKYQDFIAAFPDFKSLADASLARVLNAWQGLGYNRRGLALKKIAEIITNDFQDRLPETEIELRKLPGIGKYTSAAILAFAFNKPALVLDTNIRVVFIHFFFDDRDKVTDNELLPFIEATIDNHNPRKWYSALFDYGAMLKKTASLNDKSAHYHKQSRFQGSNRQLRSSILRTVLAHPAIMESELTDILGTEEERISKNLEALHREGFIVREKGNLYIAP